MTESTNVSETETTTTEPSSEGSARERLAALLQEEQPGTAEGEAGGSQQNAEPQAGAPQGKPKKFNDLAGRLEGVELDDLYKLEVMASKDGKPVTVEMLKDAHAKQDDFVVRELAFEERVAKQEAELTRSQTEFAELMASLDPKAITPEVKERVRQKVDASVKRERELTLKAIPEWQNATVREAELGAMVEFLKDFGIHETFLTGTMNHKLFRLVRYATLQKQRIDKALAKVETVRRPSTTGKSGAGNGAARKPDIKPQARARVTARDRLQKALNS